MEVIAEIGSNWKTHEDCYHAVRRASQIGADVVKFQHFRNQDLYGEAGPRNQLPPLLTIKDKCDKEQIEFMCTAFSPDGYLSVDPLVKRHKVASAEITDVDILETVSSFRKPVILSTGGAFDEQIDRALDILKWCDVTLMYCVTEYPARIVDFRRLEKLKDRYGNRCQYGYSDHSVDVLNIPVLARDHGSVILEKHVNFSSHVDTPDAPHSLNDLEFTFMVENLRGLVFESETFRKCAWQRQKTERGYFRPAA